MRIVIIGGVLLTFIMLISLTAIEESQSSYQDLKQEAERHIENGSYALAHSLYTKVDKKQLSSAQARWVDFRQADTLWRSEAATNSTDTTKLDQARQQLEVLIRDIQRVEDRDRVWVEVQESLGDFWWSRRNSRNWSQAWIYYQAALDWWAGSSDLDLARARYLKIVWTLSKPPEVEPYYYYGYYGNNIPLEILENTLKVAKSGNDNAHAHYLLAMTLRSQGGDWEQRQRVPDEFESALRGGKSTEWYDDTLFNYADWMASQGRAIALEDGQWRSEPDFVKALELYRRLVSEFRKGETRYYDQAQQQIKTITEPALQVSVPNVFLPGSEVQYQLNWRNINKVDLSIYKIDLLRDIRMSEKAIDSDWFRRVDLSQATLLKRWSKVTETKRDYKPEQESLHLEEKLPMGAYLLEATGNEKSSRDILLVTDTSLVIKRSGNQDLTYFCNALTGAPVAGASVRIWQVAPSDGRVLIQDLVAKTNKDGLAVFRSPAGSYYGVFAAAAVNDRQAFTVGYHPGYYQDEQPWRIYAFTDRPAYRPKETVQWKFVARRTNGQIYSTPASQTIEFEVIDPRGTKVKEERVVLNSFGSGWGSLELSETMPLGQYSVSFWEAGKHRQIGSAALFRLEEYKLPEFKVSVKTPEEDGKKKTFRLGDKVEVNVQADYYFGGPVSNANVEVVVHQNPFFQGWFPWRDYPWFYEDIDVRSPYYGGEGQVIKRETLKTDSTGKVTLSFETPRNDQQDFEYRIEARVTDASRREIVASERVRVTRQRFYVYPRPEHNLYRPQDKVTINIKALDANDQPVMVEGRVKLTRDYWFEIWMDPDGNEVKGEELRRLQEKSQIFPPLPASGRRPWQLKFKGYQQDEILTRPMKTDASGEAQLIFTPEREGYYRMNWTSQDLGRAPIRAETTVWVARNATTELGYRHGGLEIIVDKDTFRAGKTAVVMISVPTQDRYVLFSTEGEGLYDYQLVHVTGTVKLMELLIEDKHVPNIFLNAVMVSDRQIFEDTKQVVVPPVQHFLKMEVKADRSEYQPQEEGTLNITTTDAEGKPVSTEVALGVADESIFYIQQDYAGDPRQFFFGRKRSHRVSTSSTFNMKSYAKLVEGPQNQLWDERVLSEMEKNERDRGIGTGQEGGIGGGMFRASAGIVGGVAGRARWGGRVDGLALPAAAPGPGMAKSASMMRVGGRVAAEMAKDQAQSVTVSNGEEPAVQVRTDFRATVFWQPNVITDKDGKATIRFKYPDSLTSWKATARAVSAANQFGIASTNTRTRQPLMIRLQAPRFFVVGDTVTISGVINNNTDTPMRVTPSLDAAGLVLQGTKTMAPVEVKSNGEGRVDWTVSVQKQGTAKLKVTARGAQYADAMEKEFPVFEHGIEKFISRSGKLRGNEAIIKLDLPAERKPESTSINIQVTPSFAVTMLDALPYLIDYPYGCTEQTMSRFLPAAVVAKTLKDLGLQPEQVMGHIFGGIEPETAIQTHPKGEKDLNDLEKMIRQGLDRLYDFQHSDGGWGWWKEGDSDHFMSAYVVWGLTLARQGGISLKTGVLERGVSYLDKELVEQENNPDLQAWMLHSLAVYHAASSSGTVSPNQNRAYKNLWANRDQLNAYTRALLALSAHSYGYSEAAKTLIENLENGVKLDSKPDISVILRGEQSSQSETMATAHWGEDGIYWRWSDGGVESTAFVLRALLAIDPQNKLVEPVMNWLIKNRRGAQWSNTRDTAIVVLSMNDYLRKSGELAAEADYEISVNGSRVGGRKVAPREVLSTPSQWTVDRQLLKSGSNEFRISRKAGNGPLYFAVQAKFFSLEEPVTAAGNELFVRRQYYRLLNKPTLLKGFVSQRLPLKDEGAVESGDRVEVVVTVEAKNNYEYLVFEDLKPAGFEAVQVRSGEPLFARELKSGTVDRKGYKESTPNANAEEGDYTGRSRWVYQELRDRKVALFVDKLPQGVWEIRYELRAEVPGKFHALPVLGHAMYVPEIRGNGEETRLTITEGPQQ